MLTRERGRNRELQAKLEEVSESKETAITQLTSQLREKKATTSTTGGGGGGRCVCVCVCIFNPSCASSLTLWLLA